MTMGTERQKNYIVTDSCASTNRAIEWESRYVSLRRPSTYERINEYYGLSSELRYLHNSGLGWV